LIGNVANFAIGKKEAANGFRIGNSIDVALIKSEAEFAGRKNEPGDFFAGIDSMRAEDAAGKDEWWRSHPGNADFFTAKIFDLMNVAFGGGLDAQTTAMNSAGDLYVDALLEGLKEIHDEMMGDIEAAEGEVVFVIGPFAFDHFRLETFFLEKAFFDGGKDGCFAGEADVADADFGKAGGSGLWPRAFVAAGEEEKTE